MPTCPSLSTHCPASNTLHSLGTFVTKDGPIPRVSLGAAHAASFDKRLVPRTPCHRVIRSSFTAPQILRSAHSSLLPTPKFQFVLAWMALITSCRPPCPGVGASSFTFLCGQPVLVQCGGRGGPAGFSLPSTASGAHPLRGPLCTGSCLPPRVSPFAKPPVRPSSHIPKALRRALWPVRKIFHIYCLVSKTVTLTILKQVNRTREGKHLAQGHAAACSISSSRWGS